MIAFSDVTRYSSSALTTALSTATAVVEAAKALIGPVSPPLPSMLRGRMTYYPLSSLRRDQYEVVFLMEGGHEVLGFKLTPNQPRRVPFRRVLQGNAFEEASYFVKREYGGTSELPRSAWPVAWRPQASQKDSWRSLQFEHA